MKNILLLLSILFVINAGAQSNWDCQKNEDFQMKLQKFRFSLYADLMPQKENIYKNIDKFFTDTSTVIYKKSKKFFNDNNSDIKEFQKYELGKYLKNDIDFSKYKIDTTYNIILTDTVDWSYFSSLMFTYSYLTFNPISYSLSLDNMFLAKAKTPTEMGSSSVINYIASPMIKTKMLKNDKWEIYIDNYEYVFIYEFNLSDNKIKATKVLKRSL